MKGEKLWKRFYMLWLCRNFICSGCLVPTIAPASTDPSDPVDMWPRQDEKLEQLHSPEAYEMIQNHLALILGNRTADSTTVAKERGLVKVEPFMELKK